jgi:hypothetical protein
MLPLVGLSVSQQFGCAHRYYLIQAIAAVLSCILSGPAQVDRMEHPLPDHCSCIVVYLTEPGLDVDGGWLHSN